MIVSVLSLAGGLVFFIARTVKRADAAEAASEAAALDAA